MDTPRAREEMYVSTSPDSLFEKRSGSRGITSPPKLTICPASHTTMKRGKSFSAATGIGARVRAVK